MSEENVKIARELHAAFNEGNTGVVLEHLHPDLVWEEDTTAFPGIAPAYRGPGGFVEWRDFIAEAWREFSAVPSELIEVGNDVVIVTDVEAKGEGSGIDVSMRVFQIWTFQNGKLIRRRYFFDRAEALEAAGLSE
jgi:ketosteroid isomerase-like protein